MRINPISTNIINKTYNVKKTESAKINAQKPLSTDSVQFKAAPWYATEYNQIFWKALKAGDKRISRLPKFANTNFDKIDALYKSLGKTIKSFPSRLLSDDFHFIYKYY